MSRLLAIAVVLALNSGCAHVDRLIVSGEAVDQVGERFITTWEGFNAGFKSGRISADEYDKWAEFAARARPLYHEAASAWRAARKAGDAAEEKKWGDAALAIGFELAKFYDALKEARLLPKGAP